MKLLFYILALFLIDAELYGKLSEIPVKPGKSSWMKK